MIEGAIVEVPCAGTFMSVGMQNMLSYVLCFRETNKTSSSVCWSFWVGLETAIALSTSIYYPHGAPQIGPGILKQVSEVYRKLRGTLRFLLGNLAGFDLAVRLSYSCCTAVVLHLSMPSC